ncbi:MAG: hypothetical protein KY466_06995 [Gemmatimonadetes bacterium]|nr:hypothetical protein [Gemmatimonadota bacterium]
MSHLTLEALARLLDEAPSAEEEGHLAGCEVCRDELAALRGQTDALASLPKMVPAPEAWAELRDRLEDERLIAGAAPRRFYGPLRTAAAIVLFAGGGLLGYGVRGNAEDAPSTEVVADRGVLAENGAGTAVEPAPREQQGGLRRVEEAQEAFLSALDQYMAATGTSPSDPATRLATLDNIVLTTAEALNEAPADPVINSFHLTALAQRNAMLRQISTSSDPVF